MKRERKIVWLWCAVLALVLSSCSISGRLAKADKAYRDGMYYSVEKQYRKLSRRVPKKDKELVSMVYFRIGDCNQRLFDMRKAENYYLRALKYGYQDSTLLLNLAKTQMTLGKYASAKKYFEQYLQKNPTSREALDGLISAEHARELLKKPSRYKVVEFSAFNTKKSSQFSPAFIGSDGSAVAFTTNRNTSKKQKKSDITGKLNFDIYISNKNRAQKWEKPQIIALLNVPEDDGVCSFTGDGRVMYFSRSLITQGESRGATVMMTMRQGGEWSEPQEVKLFVDSTIMAAHPAISPDGNTLYFVSDDTVHSSGLGGKDIYVSEKVDGGWGVPQNLGSEINTSGNEMFPYVAYDGTLYFSSDGRQGFGGLDIYRARKDSTGKWNVENMLNPINSPYDDFGITFEGDKPQGFFSSNRGNRKALDNIYWFELPEITYFVEGKVTDEGDQPLDAIVKIVGNDGSIIKQRVKKNGTYRAKLSANVNYVMLASNRGHLNSSHSLTTVGEQDSKLFKVDFELPSIAKPVKMENVFYEFGKWEVAESSEGELKQLVKLLEDNPNITIEISAHTDSVGSEQVNLELSQKRAGSVVDYLIRAGVAADRLQPKGYGESKPVVVDEALSKKHRFLKEGDELTPQFISKLTPEQQELCNQINRRTEFRVLRTTYNLY